MNPIRPAFALLASLAFSGAIAQDGNDYSLNGGQVRFHAPDGWSAVMQKTDGNPQAIAFQVPDPGARGSDDSATVTVKTRQLANSAQFAMVVQDEIHRATEQPGYESTGASGDASSHRYHVTRGKTRYHVHDRFLQDGDLAVEVRCQRPLLASSPESWNARFDAECDALAASLRQ